MEQVRVDSTQRPKYLAPELVEPVVARYRGTLLAEDFKLKSAPVVLEVMKRMTEKKKEARLPAARLKRFDAKAEHRTRLKDAALRDASYLRSRLRERPVLRGIVAAEARLSAMEKVVKAVDRAFHDGRQRFRQRKAQVMKLDATIKKWEPAADRDRRALGKIKTQIGKYQRFTSDQRRARTLVALGDRQLRSLLQARLPYLATLDVDDIEMLADEIRGERARMILEGVGLHLVAIEAAGKFETIDIAASLEPALGPDRSRQREQRHERGQGLTRGAERQIG